jgi:glutamyl-tRNA synthetase
MEVTHIIRGDDHLTNAARQVTIYQAMNWNIPIFAHIPLIHGDDGKKLSKRHGALGVNAYQDMGYLPETLCNYLLRLGWSHGDDEIINKSQAIEWFNLTSIGKSPSRLDFKKLDNINNHYLQLADNHRILDLISDNNLSNASKSNILAGLDSLKQRAKTLLELKEMANIYIVEEKIDIPTELKETILLSRPLISEFCAELNQIQNWNKDELMSLGKAFAEKKQIKLGELGGYLRIILTGSTTSPSVFEIIAILGLDSTLRRIADVYNS